jgi:hypothetical protein
MVADKRIASVVAAGLFGVALVAGLAQAYSTFCLPGWPSAAGFYKDNSTSFPASTGSVTDVRNAIQASANEWTNRGGSRFVWTYQGTTTQTSNIVNDSFTAIFWVDATMGNVLAVTTCGGNGVRGADTECFNVGFRTNGNDFDLKAVVTHELGHAAGLGHTTTSGATMYATYFGPAQGSIEEDDIAGIQSIYGLGVPPAPTSAARTRSRSSART